MDITEFSNLIQFQPWAKTPRLFREMLLTEKLDGTNSSVVVIDKATAPADVRPEFLVAETEGFFLLAGSRTRWITPGKTTDNYGFATWVALNAEELVKLGPGRHFGEWWGGGIQRNYGLPGADKRFSLFNVDRWQDGATKTDIRTGEVTALSPRPACCRVVPVLYRGPFDTTSVECELLNLRNHGSKAVPGYMKPEGLIVFHTAAQRVFKVLLENDDKAKGE